MSKFIAHIQVQSLEVRAGIYEEGALNFARKNVELKHRIRELENVNNQNQ